MYEFLNTFFIIFHCFLVLFILLGWLWKKIRTLHLILLMLTVFSWFILGIWYGIGYCPLTEWHWQVRYELGCYDMPYSYIKFLLDTITGLDWDPIWVDYGTAISFFTALTISIVLNINDRRSKRTSSL